MANSRRNRKRRARKEADELAEARELAPAIEGAKIAVRAKAGGNGKLFGAVTNADVASVIAGVLDIDIDRHKIEMTRSDQGAGALPVEIKLHKGVVAKTVVDVVSGIARQLCRHSRSMRPASGASSGPRTNSSRYVSCALRYARFGDSARISSCCAPVR